MSFTKRAIDKALHNPWDLTPAERAFTAGIRPEWECPERDPTPPDDLDGPDGDHVQSGDRAEHNAADAGPWDAIDF